MEQLSVGRDQKAASAPPSFLVDHSYPPMTMKWIKGGKPLHLFWDMSTGEPHEHWMFKLENLGGGWEESKGAFICYSLIPSPSSPLPIKELKKKSFHDMIKKTSFASFWEILHLVNAFTF